MQPHATQGQPQAVGPQDQLAWEASQEAEPQQSLPGAAKAPPQGTTCTGAVRKEAEASLAGPRVSAVLLGHLASWCWVSLPPCHRLPGNTPGSHLGAWEPHKDPQ